MYIIIVSYHSDMCVWSDQISHKDDHHHHHHIETEQQSNQSDIQSDLFKVQMMKMS